MASTALSARLKYLNDSAHLLAVAAPATSAYLMSQCNDLMFVNELEPSEARRRHVCGACGNIMVVGWSGRMDMNSMKPRKRKRVAKTDRGQAPTTPRRMMRYTCDRCSRVTIQEITAPKPQTLGNKQHRSRVDSPHVTGQPSTPIAGSPLQTEHPATGLAKSSRKKRGNWKQNSLQALLTKSKETEARAGTGVGFGLSLMDLMKKA